ncbi:3-polyprenyl-4-hydroxybenzoate carboxy-lyase UbiX [hydrothermal vent metagenome]|jgi:4-hydroxy-3-polyprenylbenzoate decarboxylase|uniref:flavin prenyltransferase n=1 Tax=hydrothermal vent metagenome TaxID=652676 RepID=A0A160TWK6_9ZZZZ|nr:UbiX family flavin prenyltransferase [Arenicellales bacterium]MDK2752306.1 UbiX family flavin prenyltransferase [Gammaproteobacteria bacterium]|tara:strand:- start:470 stop:1051 length:582 start_codon:yes stop_codon:yes gene_type:complete
MKQRLIVGISGASGAIYGIRLLEILQKLPEIDTLLIISKAAKRTIVLETDYKVDQVEKLANEVLPDHDIAASVSSGSYKTSGMVVIPCSIKTLSGIANSYADNLLVRAADVVLKEQRKLVLVLRETPLHLGHTQLMTRSIEIGATLLPAMPAFYHRPSTIDDLINQTVNRVLDQFDIELPDDLFERWAGSPKK